MLREFFRKWWVRFLLGFVVVFGTWNPTGYHFVDLLWEELWTDDPWDVKIWYLVGAFLLVIIWAIVVTQVLIQGLGFWLFVWLGFFALIYAALGMSGIIAEPLEMNMLGWWFVITGTILVFFGAMKGSVQYTLLGRRAIEEEGGLGGGQE